MAPSSTGEAGGWIGGVFVRMTRRMVLRHSPLDTKLKRVLTTAGVTLFGIGQMAGGGPFVVAGAVAHMAGPGMVISFLIAGFTAILSGLCFAEFASAIPRTGSGYLFTYVTMGEFVAFLVGWQMILDQMLNVASVSSAVSGAVDAFANLAVANFTIAHVGPFPRESLLAPFPDFLAFGIGILSAVTMCFGFGRSAFLCNVLNAVNLLVILFCLAFGFATVDRTNWTYQGFLPYGFAGVMRGASSSFTSYIGFEGIASAGEETINPKRSIPLALMSSLLVLVVLYILMAVALTLAVPFEAIDLQAAFPEAFAYHGYIIEKNITSIGIALGMFGALIGSLYAVSRTAYAMASDGMFFKPFARISERTKGPLFGEVFFGVLAAFFALIFNLEILVEFQCVGTLMAYTIVAGCSIVFHYQRRVRVYADDVADIEIYRVADRKEDEEPPEPSSLPALIRYVETVLPRFAVDIALLCFAIFVGLAFATTIDVEFDLEKWVHKTEWWPLIPGLVMSGCAVICFLVILYHRKRHLRLYFKFYLGDFNLNRDKFFGELVRRRGWVPLDAILKCNRVKPEEFSELELDETNTKIKTQDCFLEDSEEARLIAILGPSIVINYDALEGILEKLSRADSSTTRGASREGRVLEGKEEKAYFDTYWIPSWSRRKPNSSSKFNGPKPVDKTARSPTPPSLPRAAEEDVKADSPTKKRRLKKTLSLKPPPKRLKPRRKT
ncbi:putative cationic amino acid transporter [Hypsibius exemplaris]|uniref:Cationic amino acid transporter n=1 Tax=Hypsibius exemplaris TaxID=2072580 RepID=A0A1W0WC90_HYPEX|nr:putative cationic amino acid transporter [Hypsibius exemplaris]